eukprot:121101_1
MAASLTCLLALSLVSYSMYCDKRLHMHLPQWTSIRHRKQSYAISLVGCPNDKIMISCSPHTNGNSLDGAYVGTDSQSTTINSETLCIARNAKGVSGVWAKGICCKMQIHGNDG